MSRLDALAEIMKKAEFHAGVNTPAAESEPKKEEAATKKDLDALAAKLSSSSGNQQQSAVLQGLLSDPNIATYLQAKQAGKNVKILEDLPPGQVQTQDEDPDFSGLDDQTKKMFTAFQKKQEREMKKILNAALEPVTKRVEGVSGVIQHEQDKQLTAEIQACKDKHPDFDEYVQDIYKINIQTGNALRPEELYMMAKMRKGETKSKRDTSTESERASESVARPAQSQARVERGPAGLSKAIGSAFDRAMSRVQTK